MSEVLLLHYPRCSTCIKARRWLDSTGTEYEARDVTAQPPTPAELTEWLGRSSVPIQKFFNTSGRLYRELNVKDHVKSASQEDLIALLASNGMLVKRPLLITPRGVCPGFKEDIWRELLR